MAKVYFKVIALPSLSPIICHFSLLFIFLPSPPRHNISPFVAPPCPGSPQSIISEKDFFSPLQKSHSLPPVLGAPPQSLFLRGLSPQYLNLFLNSIPPHLLQSLFIIFFLSHPTPLPSRDLRQCQVYLRRKPRIFHKASILVFLQSGTT